MRVAAMYAVPASWVDGSMMLMSAHSGRSGGVTFSHVPPLSCDTCTSPSSDPAHSSPACTGDSAKAKMVP